MAIAELVSDLAAALDPIVLAQQAGLEPDPWQADVLRSTAPRVLLNCSRQSGKSTVSALLALHTALYTPGSFRIGTSEIRPLRGAIPLEERDGRERTRSFIPGGRYRIEKFPALERLMHEWEGVT
jgi:hypothetical protein